MKLLDDFCYVDVGKSGYKIYYDIAEYVQNDASEFPCVECGYKDNGGVTIIRKVKTGEIINSEKQTFVSPKGSRGRAVIKKLKHVFGQPLCDCCLFYEEYAPMEDMLR